MNEEKSRSDCYHSPAQCCWGGGCPVRRVGVGYTLLRNSPPVGCSGVLHSEEFLALSLLLLGSLSLMMSYWRQKRAMTPWGQKVNFSHSDVAPVTAALFVCLFGVVLTCPHDENHHNDDDLPRPQLSTLAHFLHRHLVWRSQYEACW